MSYCRTNKDLSGWRLFTNLRQFGENNELFVVASSPPPIFCPHHFSSPLKSSFSSPLSPITLSLSPKYLETTPISIFVLWMNSVLKTPKLRALRDFVLIYIWHIFSTKESHTIQQIMMFCCGTLIITHNYKYHKLATDDAPLWCSTGPPITTNFIKFPPSPVPK